MKKLAAALILVLLAAPVAALFEADATNLTWSTQLSTANATKYRDALLWYYDGQPLNGLLATAARTNITLTDVGGGNSKFAIAMPLSAGNTWVANLVVVACPTANTATLRRACADPMIKSDIKRVWEQYEAYLRSLTPPAAPPEP